MKCYGKRRRTPWIPTIANSFNSTLAQNLSVQFLFFALVMLALHLSGCGKQSVSQNSPANQPKPLVSNLANTNTANTNTAPLNGEKVTPLDGEKTARVIAINANLRNEPNNNAEVITVLPEGTRLAVAEQKGPWFRARTDNFLGWLHGNTIRLETQAAQRVDRDEFADDEVDSLDDGEVDLQKETRRKTFKGYQCKYDCSGHRAGYEWAERKGITDPDDCGGNSRSFIEGCRAYAEDNEW